MHIVNLIIGMDEEFENKNSFDLPFPHDSGHNTGRNIPQNISRKNEEEASDYPEGIEGFTPPKDLRIHKLMKAKTDRKTIKKPLHKGHSAIKLGKKEQRPTKSKSMILLPSSPDVNVSHKKQRHFSIPPGTRITSEENSSEENTLEFPLLIKNIEEENPVIQQPQSPPLPEINKSNEAAIESKQPAVPSHDQLYAKSWSPSIKKDLPKHMSPLGSWQKSLFRRRSSVDVNAISIVSRTSSSPSSSLFDSLYDLRKPRTSSLNLLPVHVDQDDRLDFGLPSRSKPGSLHHRHTSSYIPECPKERNEFYSHLHMTVLHLGIANAVARRHGDPDETHLTKESIHQSISLQLRAYLQNRSVRVVSDELAMKKLDVDRTISDILDFTLPLECELNRRELFRPFSLCSSYAQISTDSSDGYGEDSKSLAPISEEEISSEPQSMEDTLRKDKISFCDDQFMTSAQARAMEKVKEVLKALDEAESLYQSFAEMGDENPKYRSLEFVRRVEALQLWVRITEMLASKLCQMSQLCGIRVDLEPGQDDVCLQSLNSSRISWNVLEMEQTRTSCYEKKYRDFVDQHLKKYGLEKMMKLVKKSLSNALLIARYIRIYSL